jgi:glycosyltransferase involved in cell wall biosynthesis
MDRMAKTRVSVVVPTFNRAGLLGRALRSVFGQTRPADEVIVVDDGSTDDTGERVQRDFPGVRYLRQDQRGVSAARNRGVVAAEGEWIAFLDADDEWRRAKLERQLAALGDHPGCLICHTDEIWIRRGQRVNPRKRHAKAGGYIFQRCLPRCAISPSSVLIHRTLLDEVGGFDETLPACEDYDLWLRICWRHEVVFVDEPLVVKHGGHADQLSRQQWGMDRFRIRALEKVLGSAELAPGDREAARSTLLEKIDIYLEGARKRGKWDEVEEYEAKGKKYSS